MPAHLIFRPLLAALLLCSAQAAHLTVLDSPDPAQLRVRVSEDDWFAGRADAPGDPVALNVLRNLARLLPDSLPGVPVTCQPERGPAVEVVTDLLGYATCPLPAGTTGVTTVRIQGATPVQVPPPAVQGAAHLTVTDLDDTVIVTGVVQGRTLRSVLTANGTTRPLFPDVPALLRGQAARGPVVYLSTSPDGLAVSLRTLLHVHGLPEGPLFLRDLFREGATDHKGHVLDTLARVTTARFTLIGDSGERDPETYARFVREHPGRVERLLIRDVGTPARRQEVERLLTPLGVPFGFLPAAP